MLHAPPRVHVGRVLLTVLAAVLFGLGWLAGASVRLVWPALAFMASAVKVGFTDARSATRH